MELCAGSYVDTMLTWPLSSLPKGRSKKYKVKSQKWRGRVGNCTYTIRYVEISGAVFVDCSTLQLLVRGRIGLAALRRAALAELLPVEGLKRPFFSVEPQSFLQRMNDRRRMGKVALLQGGEKKLTIFHFFHGNVLTILFFLVYC